MSLKDNISFLFLFCVLGKVTLSKYEVVLVNRSRIDSFRVGIGGCTNDTSVCPSSATCQGDGSCQCNNSTPTYRNPVIKTDGEIALVYGDSYGCVNNLFINIRFRNGPAFCPFSPFQVIPYGNNDPATKFTHDDPNVELKSCSLRKAWAKFPDSVTETELPEWLDETYVDLKVSSNILHFRWRKTVPHLQGTIITFNLMCDRGSGRFESNCLRAKVLGQWKSVATNYITSKKAAAVDPVIILTDMDRVIMKTLQHHLIQKDGQAVRRLGTISLEFIVDLAKTSLTILTNFDAAKWL
ncbi:Hypothetical predicted protein [Paramuricea clavata]|uniref:Uncharacterized protein n=1 Tax=Paramuricea clavata TaxID=317549 RepID=A0A7D9LCB9_PARCT|nr:Hypothetical predicted protein [Paramuricea clavata]